MAGGGTGSSESYAAAGNFEKILINLKFEKCSRQFMVSLINFCHKFRLSTALMYLCMQAYADGGPVTALTQLRDFYDEITKEEGRLQ